MMTNRELWVSVFCKALEVGGRLLEHGQTLGTQKEIGASVDGWAQEIADWALEEAAPKEEE